MIEILPLIILALFLIAGGLYHEFRRDKDDQCPPHKWIDGADGHLVCDKCKRRPGELPVTRFHYPDKGGFV